MTAGTARLAGPLAIVLLPVAALAAPAGRVVVGQAVDPTTLDAMNQAETPASNVARHLYDTLVERDRNLRLVPMLAAELPRAVAPTVWEITLRRGVRFHNGEAFDAESAKFSLERLSNPANRLRGSAGVSVLERVEIVDADTIRVHTKRPWPIFPKLLALAQVPMYPPRAYAGKDSGYVSRNPIGTGPYRLVLWLRDEELVLEANEQYWRGAPRIKTVVFRPVPDDAVRVAALQNGELDVAVNIPPHLAPLIAKHPRLLLATVPSGRTIQLMVYTHQVDAQHRVVGPYPGPTADRRVRQAIASALDVDAVIRTILDGRAVRLASMLTERHFGFDPQLAPIRPDPARSRRLLVEAGFPSGIDLVLNGPQGRYVRDREVADALAAQLTAAGIRTTVRTHEWGSFLTGMVYAHRAGPIWLSGWGASAYDAETVYLPLFRTGGPFVNAHDPELDRLVDEALTLMDEPARLAHYQRITRRWAEELPAIPLYQPIDLYGVSRRLRWTPRGDEVIRADEMALPDGR